MTLQKINALIIGKSGQLARELIDVMPSNINAVALGKANIDLFSRHDIENKITNSKASVVINASAYTAVDNAEDDKVNAYALNEEAVINLASICNHLKIRLIHISTDFVFDGQASTPYLPDNLPEPISIYGKSKLAGEKAILNIAPEFGTIVRTSWLYSRHGNNFVKTMLNLMKSRDSLNIVCDQYGSPTCAKGLAEFIWDLSKQTKALPIYHWCDSGVTSWFDFAVSIQDYAFELGILNKKINIGPIPASDYPTKAKRPLYSALNCTSSNKIKPQAKWQESLKLMLNKLKEK